MKKLLVLIASTFFMHSANAAIINLDAYDKAQGNPVIQTLTLGAGTYDVTVVGIGDGGEYDAWNAWGRVTGCESDGKNCSTGWINNYTISAAELGTTLYSDGVRYATPLLALEYAIDTSFTLSSVADVDFYIGDSRYTDNWGGISLDVSLVPEPSVIALFGLGLVGLGFARRRKA